MITNFWCIKLYKQFQTLYQESAKCHLLWHLPTLPPAIRPLSVMFVSVAFTTPTWLLRRPRLETTVKPTKDLTPWAKYRLALPLWLLRANNLLFQNLPAWPLRREQKNTNRSPQCWIRASAVFTILILTVVDQPSAARDPRLRARWCESLSHIWQQFARSAAKPRPRRS